MLERETSREKNLEKAQKEARIRARKEAQRAADGVPSVADDGADMQQVLAPTDAQTPCCAFPISPVADRGRAHPAGCIPRMQGPFEHVRLVVRWHVRII